MLASTDLAMALDPVRMARTAGVEADDWQARVLRSQAQRILMLASRQSGKSTTAALLAAHTAFYQPGSTTLLLSPSLRQSGELFRKCLEIYRALDRPQPAEAESALRLELKSGSRIISLPGKEGTIRGISAVTLLIIDEASRVSDELYASVRPMLAVSGGRLVLLSTPFACRGFFYQEWLRRQKWDYYEVPASACPRISPEFLAEEKEAIGEFYFASEYECKFLDAIGAAFRTEDIEKIVSREVNTWAL